MTSPVSPSETLAKAMEGVTPDKLRYEADGMYAAVNGEEYGDTFHLQNWNDKPHRVVFDAIDLLRSAADHLDATALQLEAMQREMTQKDERIAALEKALKPFSIIAAMEENAEPFTTVMVNVDRCRDARTVLEGARTLIQGEKK